MTWWIRPMQIAAQNGKNAADAARYRWLTEDHADSAVRRKCRSILEHAAVRTYGAASHAIDGELARHRTAEEWRVQCDAALASRPKE